MVEEKTIYTFDQPLTRYQFSDINLTIVSGYPPMSEDEPTPEPTPTPPEPSDPTELTITAYMTDHYETETVHLPITFNVSTYNSSVIAKKTDSTYNIIIGANAHTNNNGYTFANYTTSFQNHWVATQIGDFTFTQFLLYNISIPYLSEDPDVMLGTDNINNLTIDSFVGGQTFTTLPTTGYVQFAWSQTHTQFYYFLYDKTDDIFYETDTNNPVQIDNNHEVYYCDNTSNQGITHFKTTNGYITYSVADVNLSKRYGYIKITNASKYLPSVTTL